MKWALLLLLAGLPVLALAGSSQAARPARPAYSQTVQPYFAALKRICPAKRLEWLPAGALIDDTQSFPQTLAPGLRRRFEAAVKPTLRRCRGRDGASCENVQTLSVIEKLGLTRRFAGRVCTVHLSCRRQSDCD